MALTNTASLSKRPHMSFSNDGGTVTPLSKAYFFPGLTCAGVLRRSLSLLVRCIYICDDAVGYSLCRELFVDHCNLLVCFIKIICVRHNTSRSGNTQFSAIVCSA